MRPAVLSLLFIGSLISSGCAGDLRSQPPPEKWTTGFWFWGDNWEHLAPVTHSPDALFVHVASFGGWPANQDGPIYADIPIRLPQAHEYWLVYRYDKQAVPAQEQAFRIASSFAEVLSEARRRNLNVAGLQLDIDSPTKSLSQYAAFLRTLRTRLPAGTQVSVTCLLDWFRDGTSVADVIRETDEFVPQFYDAAAPDARTPVIAVRFDPERWGPIFNRFGKRFRIGISTFGRGEILRDTSAPNEVPRVASYSDLRPLDLAVNPAFAAQMSQNEAGETVLTFRVVRPVSLNWDTVQPGTTFQFVVPNPEGIRKSIADAHRMGRYCGGVVFFRWPAPDEVLVMSPDEILSGHPATPTLDLIDGACAAVACVDLYLVNGGNLNRTPIRYRIMASDELGYFLPDPAAPVRLSGRKELDVSIPAWGGRGRIYLGRAVSPSKVTFSLESVQ